MESLIEKRLGRKGSEIIIKDEEENSMGSAIIRMKNNIAKIGYISIKKNLRNKGLAKQLLEKCEEWAKEHGATATEGTLIPIPGSEREIIKVFSNFLN